MKSTIIPALILIFCGSLVFTACKHDPMVVPSTTPSNDGGGSNGNTNNSGNGSGNGGGGNTTTCDPNIVYFQNDILPLFVSNCAMSSCHDAQSHQKDIILDSYSNIINTGEIRAYDVSHGKVYEKITESNPDDRMPPSPRPQLSTAQINMIATWINQGAQNNVCIETGGCDTLNVTYAGRIAPLLQTKCTGCHNGSASGANINLSAYPGVQAVALNGRLLGAVNHAAGYSAMPRNLPKLPDCDIAQIRIWIQHGALNN